ncbi:hypothetical protein H0H87_010445 [Tephrocybe sp. NHM501043]|nr:hypothetical protein H0H87_010445 [Tephrocybe sp. NHM501043]
MAGGDSAIRRAAEGAEDSTTLPIADLDAIVPPINPLDTLIGIAASGRTPYVLAGLTYCRESRGMLTVGVSCVQPSEMRGRAECLIECIVGAEVVTGSTRMKAGTATKLILNMISTGVMIRIGKTHGNLVCVSFMFPSAADLLTLSKPQMVDVKSSNKKLIDRARRIFRTLLPRTSLSDTEIDALVASCDGSVKLAAVVEKLHCSVSDAQERLEAAGGVLRRAWDTSNTAVNVPLRPPLSAPQLVLAVDAGGTKCSAIIANKHGIQSRAESGPCNFVTRGHDAALLTMSEAINRAIEFLPEGVLPTSRLRIPLNQPLFGAAWIGGAGLDRPADLEAVHSRTSKLLSLSDPATLLVTNDAALLSSAIIKHNDEQPGIAPQTKTGVVLIAGTGSLAKSFTLTSAERKLVSTSAERAGGWGYLLGDEGSAYFMGREAIRRTLRHRDAGRPPTPFHASVAAHFGCTSIGGIISAVYAPGQFREDPDAKPLDADPKLRVASLCRAVFASAYPAPPAQPDPEALEIVFEGAKSAVETLLCLLQDKDKIDPATSTLVLGGALGQIEEYKGLIVQELEKKGKEFASVEANYHISDAQKFLELGMSTTVIDKIKLVRARAVLVTGAVLEETSTPSVCSRFPSAGVSVYPVYIILSILPLLTTMPVVSTNDEPSYVLSLPANEPRLVVLFTILFISLFDPEVNRSYHGIGKWTGLIILSALLSIFLIEYISTSYVDHLHAKPSAPSSPSTSHSPSPPKTPQPIAPIHLPAGPSSDPHPATPCASPNCTTRPPTDRTPLLQNPTPRPELSARRPKRSQSLYDLNDESLLDLILLNAPRLSRGSLPHSGLAGWGNEVASHEGHGTVFDEEDEGKKDLLGVVGRKRQVVGILILQLGIMIHSFVIGLTLAIATGTDFTSLVTAIVFHQLFEGLSLGIRIAGLPPSSTPNRRWLAPTLSVLFAITTPLGMGIGALAFTSAHKGEAGVFLSCYHASLV